MLWLALSGATCGVVTGAEGERPDPGTPASIEIVADGGIAALHNVAHVDSATGTVYWVHRTLCAPSAGCPPGDSLTGVLARTAVDAFFARVATSEFRSLHADYGTTAHGADMRLYTVTIHAGGRVRSLRADDGTMPALLGQFVGDVTGAVRDAVK